MRTDTLIMIELDRHTAPFFAPEFHRGAVEATFDLRGVIFEARVARDVGSKARVVMQLKEYPQRGSFVLKSIPRWDDLAQQGPSPQLWEKITSLHEKPGYVYMSRMHFYPPENQMILLHKYCCGSLIDLENPRARAIEFDFNYQKIPALYCAHEWEEYLAWEAEGAFAMIEQVARDPQSELRQTLNTLKTDDHFKANQAFGCSLSTFSRMRSLLKAALIVEMAKGELGETGKWFYWLEKSFGFGRYQLLPENLTNWKTRICRALFCRELNLSNHQYRRTTANYRITGPQEVINRWLTSTLIEVSAPTMHEVLEAQLQLREFECQYAH